MRLLRVGTCNSLSERSTLTYQIGCNEDSNVHVRLLGNTGKGFYSKDWIAYALIDAQLLQGCQEKPDASQGTNASS